MPAILVNFPVCIEKHVDWVVDAMNYVRDAGAVEIEPLPEYESAWVDKISADVEGTLMTTTDSWYMNSNLPGKPKVFMAYFPGMPSYAEICDEVAANGYRGFNLKTEKMAVAV